MAKRGRPRKNQDSVVTLPQDDRAMEKKEAGGLCEFTLTADNEILLNIAKKYMLVLYTVEGCGPEKMNFDGLMNYLIEKALVKLIKEIADQYRISVNELKYAMDCCDNNGSLIRDRLEVEFTSIYDKHRSMFLDKTPASGTQHELFPDMTFDKKDVAL
jgi:hypothetical protein